MEFNAQPFHDTTKDVTILRVDDWGEAGGIVEVTDFKPPFEKVNASLAFRHPQAMLGLRQLWISWDDDNMIVGQVNTVSSIQIPKQYIPSEVIFHLKAP